MNLLACTDCWDYPCTCDDGCKGMTIKDLLARIKLLVTKVEERFAKQNEDKEP